jgi:pilus assembly protein Flp/PilA
MHQLRNGMARLEVLRLSAFARDDEGQTLVEYALILVFIAIVVIVVVTALGGRIRSIFGNVSDQL